MIEIRWHGRGGQGAKTAALLFADVALAEGKYVQAFPEYGPERMGAPVMAFNRISDNPIYIHCQITSPQIVVVLDASLIGKVNVVQGLSDDGNLIINTRISPAEMRKRLQLQGRKIYTVDASGISLQIMGRELPNTPMLGALMKVTDMFDFQRMLEGIRTKLTTKFRQHTEIIEGNIKSIQRAYEEVRAE